MKFMDWFMYLMAFVADIGWTAKVMFSYDKAIASFGVWGTMLIICVLIFGIGAFGCKVFSEGES